MTKFARLYSHPDARARWQEPADRRRVGDLDLWGWDPAPGDVVCDSRGRRWKVLSVGTYIITGAPGEGDHVLAALAFAGSRS